MDWQKKNSHADCVFSLSVTYHCHIIEEHLNLEFCGLNIKAQSAASEVYGRLTSSVYILGQRRTIIYLDMDRFFLHEDISVL